MFQPIYTLHIKYIYALPLSLSNSNCILSSRASHPIADANSISSSLVTSSSCPFINRIGDGSVKCILEAASRLLALKLMYRIFASPSKSVVPVVLTALRFYKFNILFRVFLKIRKTSGYSFSISFFHPTDVICRHSLTRRRNQATFYYHISALSQEIIFLMFS